MATNRNTKYVGTSLFVDITWVCMSATCAASVWQIALFQLGQTGNYVLHMESNLRVNNIDLLLFSYVHFHRHAIYKNSSLATGLKNRRIESKQ